MNSETMIGSTREDDLRYLYRIVTILQPGNSAVVLREVVHLQ